MKILLSILSLLNGGFMFLDGIYVMVHGKYIGPEKPGPWALLFQKMQINVFKLGPLFIVFGLVWFLFIGLFWMRQPAALWVGILVSVLSLWYLPVGTLLSLLVLLLLLFARPKLGL